jgi:DNA gyrase subunit A
MGRNTSGVKGISLVGDDTVVGMVVAEPEATLLTVCENGYGKRSSLEDYRINNRWGKGVKTISISAKTGGLVAIKNVSDSDDLMIINKSGIAIRMSMENLRTMGRATQGVRLINLKGGDSIAAVAKVMKEEDNLEDADVRDLDVQAEENGTNIDSNNPDNQE